MPLFTPWFYVFLLTVCLYLTSVTNYQITKTKKENIIIKQKKIIKPQKDKRDKK